MAPENFPHRILYMTATHTTTVLEECVNNIHCVLYPADIFRISGKDSTNYQSSTSRRKSKCKDAVLGYGTIPQRT
jgi:hypothetical protein